MALKVQTKKFDSLGFLFSVGSVVQESDPRNDYINWTWQLQWGWFSNDKIWIKKNLSHILPQNVPFPGLLDKFICMSSIWFILYLTHSKLLNTFACCPGQDNNHIWFRTSNSNLSVPCYQILSIPLGKVACFYVLHICHFCSCPELLHFLPCPPQ